MEIRKKSYGYYAISIDLIDSQKILRSNNERAFVISLFQDLLSPRLLLDTAPAHSQLATCLDLLAFSITTSSIECALFSIDASITRQFLDCLLGRLREYQEGYRIHHTCATPAPRIRIRKLRGPHHALAHSVMLHMRHEDWEYDRYSSIGFYLHDRRGDWMRTWRLAQLYDNNAAQYRQLLEEYTAHHTLRTLRPTTLQSFSS